MKVLLEKKEAVATITLSRPEAFNSIDGELLSQALAAVAEVESDAAVKAVVLGGSGRAFCAGGDLNYIRRELAGPAEIRSFITGVGNLSAGLRHLKKPTIAMVGGVAAGAGANLALSCDLIICSDAARFGQSFVKVGLVPDAGGLYLLPRAVGLARAKELMFTGALVEAAEALKIGLVNRVVGADELAENVYALAAELAAGPPAALAATKRALNLSLESTFEEMLALEAAEQTLALMSRDGQEGLAAFAEKRKPDFTGR